MAFKIGDKAKVVDKESLLYNKTVELIDVSNEAYIFNSENQKLKLMVHKDAIQNTVEWESSPDKGEKNIDKLLGQNGELVEERKKQVLAGALEIVQHHYEELPNKMEVVAAIFGKKYYDEFTITNDSSDYYECRAKFTEWGLMCLIDDLWQISETVLNDLLVGQAVIVDD